MNWLGVEMELGFSGDGVGSWVGAWQYLAWAGLLTLVLHQVCYTLHIQHSDLWYRETNKEVFNNTPTGYFRLELWQKVNRSKYPIIRVLITVHLGHKAVRFDKSNKQRSFTVQLQFDTKNLVNECRMQIHKMLFVEDGVCCLLSICREWEMRWTTKSRRKLPPGRLFIYKRLYMQTDAFSIR